MLHDGKISRLMKLWNKTQTDKNLLYNFLFEIKFYLNKFLRIKKDDFRHYQNIKYNIIAMQNKHLTIRSYFSN